MRAGPIGDDLDQCVAQDPSEESVRGDLHRGLPFFGIVFFLGKFSVMYCAAWRSVTTSGKHDRIEKPFIPKTQTLPSPTLRETIRALVCQLHVGT
jgi:hypothetical protein